MSTAVVLVLVGLIAASAATQRRGRTRRQSVALYGVAVALAVVAVVRFVVA